jgi:uncharacterized protein (TIGR03437 family)
MMTVAVSAQSSYVFQLPGATSVSPKQVLGFGDSDFSRYVLTGNGPTGATGIVATPTGSTFYIFAPGGVFSATPNLATHTLTTASTPISGIAGMTSARTDRLQMTPDGKYLLVISDQFYIVDTSTNTLAIGANTGLPGQSTPVSVAVSHDAKTAWILSSSSGGSVITALDLGTLKATGSLPLLSEGSSMVLSSRGLLYISGIGSALYEVDPGSLSVTSAGQMEVPNGSAGPLQFTPDGNSAYFLNRNSCANCPLIFKLNVQAHAISGWFPTDGSTIPVLEQVLVADNNRVFALTPASDICESCHKLWDVTTPLGLSPSALSATLPTSNIIAAAVSNERPSARYLYLMISDHSFYRVKLATSGKDQQISLDPANGTILSFVPIPAQSGAQTVIPINGTQSVAPNGTTVLTGQVVDADGRPVFGTTVTFSTGTCGGAFIATPTLVTGSEGWAQTAVTAPALTGTCVVTLTAGSHSADFQLLVGGGDNTGSARMSIFSGDGQLLNEHQPTIENGQPLRVRVTDASGEGIANVHVVFAVSDCPSTWPPPCGHLIGSPEADTDAGGYASVDFATDSLPFLAGFEVAFQLTKVSATSSYGTVEFYEMTYHPNTTTGLKQANVFLVTPADEMLTIPQGGFIASGIAVDTVSDAGHIPNVGLRLADPANQNLMSSVISCVGTSRGDNTGISRCDVRAACQPGVSLPLDRDVILRIGEFKAKTIHVTVTNGAPSVLAMVSGNNQIGVPSDSFTLTARVTDGCGQPAGNFSGLTWSILQGSASVSSQQTKSGPDGTVAARITFGQTAGPVKVQVSAPGLAPLIFNLTVQITVSGISLVSGSGQSVIVGQVFPAPVVFIARGPGGVPAPAGLTVNFSVSGSATVNPTSATTNAQGQVQTNVTAGTTAGPIVVTATYNAFTATANLTSRPLGPTVTSTSFTNAASGVVGMTPCGLVTVTGKGIAPTITGVVSGVTAFGPLNYSLAGVSITANGSAVPIQAVSNLDGVERANFQAPCELTPGNATVVVNVNGASTTVSGVPVFAVQPGIFTFAGPNNKLYGAVIRKVDGSYVLPSNPARQGETYFMVVTGLGQVTPVALTNSAGNGLQNVNVPMIVGLKDSGVAVISARYLVGAIGAYIVEFQIPADAPLGPDQSLAVAAIVNDNFIFGNPVFLPAVVAP